MKKAKGIIIAGAVAAALGVAGCADKSPDAGAATMKKDSGAKTSCGARKKSKGQQCKTNGNKCKTNSCQGKKAS